LEFGRGKLTTSSNRIKVVVAIDEAIASGARQFKACEVVGISERTYRRWKAQGFNTRDGRPDAVRPTPANRLMPEEEKAILEVMNKKEHRSLPPNQVFHKLIDEQGTYIASVSSFYRVLRHYGQINHRGHSKAPAGKNITTHCASGPNQVWMWDITWLPGPAKGVYYYLYMIIDLFSRKVVGWEIWDHESSDNASVLVKKAVYSENVLLMDQPLVLHSDNGSPMKGSSLLTTMYNLGIVKSNSRPRVSNDNAYIESMFRTVKYMPSFPHDGFAKIEDAREWVHAFVSYYNNEHHHSGLKFLTPNQRHNGECENILNRRKDVLKAAKAKHPERWTGSIQDCTIDDVVWLNPSKEKSKLKIC
jgi:putative transposase